MGHSSSTLDPFPTSAIRTIKSDVLTDITNVINSSLSSGCVPTAWKQGLITPLLKKPGANPEDPSNLRPVTQLRLLPRLTEAAITSRLQLHLENNTVLHDQQSGFRPGRGTELAVADVRETLLWQADRSHPVLLVLLDLSAAFDTVDHNILLRRLREVAGVEGVALDWFGSFLSGRTQAVQWGESRSSFEEVRWGVPQGSSLSPLLFNIYLRPLADLLDRIGLKYQMYADDLQLLVDLHEEANDLEKLVPGLALIGDWMRVNKLCLNSAKTELLLIEGRRGEVLPEIPWPASWGRPPTPTRQSRDLGMVLSHRLDGAAHISATVKACHFHLNALSRTFPLLNLYQKKLLYQALVGSRIQYGLILLLGATKKSLFSLQKVQNRAIRMLFNLKRRDHISSRRLQLHWLTIEDQIKAKTLCWIWKAYNKVGPRYSLRWAQKPKTTRVRRGHLSDLMAIPRIHKTKKGGATLAFKGANLWNKLPASIRSLKSLAKFKTTIKTFLLNQESVRIHGDGQATVKGPDQAIHPHPARVMPAVQRSVPLPAKRPGALHQQRANTTVQSIDTPPAQVPYFHAVMPAAASSAPGPPPRGLTSPPLPRRDNLRLIQTMHANKLDNLRAPGGYRPRRVPP